MNFRMCVPRHLRKREVMAEVPDAMHGDRMRTFLLASALLVVATPLAAAPAIAPAPPTACSIAVDVTDSDPKGLNVRTTPGGKIITALVDNGDWIELHVIAQAGDWYEIDKATQIDNEGGDSVLWQGKGYVHKSTIGLSGLQQGATVYTDHDLKSRTLVTNANGDQRTD